RARARVVYRPAGATRLGRLDAARLSRRSSRGVRAACIAAPDRETGHKTAGLLRMHSDRVTVIANDDRSGWDGLVCRLLTPTAGAHDANTDATRRNALAPPASTEPRAPKRTLQPVVSAS